LTNIQEKGSPRQKIKLSHTQTRSVNLLRVRN